MQNIRNFVIIAHIDHGKSTLADRFLELTGTVEKRKMQEQILDAMELERERGITIKMQPVRMNYKFRMLNAEKNSEFRIQNSILSNSEQNFVLNLIDTPGHIDFTYEVSRSLAAVEGAILLVDATQGVQAQTVGNLALAKKEGLTILPVINKIDLHDARIPETEAEIRKLLPEYEGTIVKVSGKTGEGVERLLQEIVEKIPPPNAPVSAPFFRALIFDSKFDPFKGIIAYVRVVDGSIAEGEHVRLLATGAMSEVLEAGYFVPDLFRTKKLSAGEIGYLATGLKEPGLVRVGDTITAVAESKHSTFEVEPLPGYTTPQPMLFASVYPEDADDFEVLKDALLKLKLNDPALSFEIESSESLGRGFRCGFLGMLHIEIVKERLRREHNLSLIFSTPSVPYRISVENGAEMMIHAPSEVPDSHLLRWIEEPWVRLEIITPKHFLGSIMKLLERTRGIFGATEYLGEDRLMFFYEAPLRAIAVDFYDHLKSATEGYASMSYEPIGFRRGNLERLDILVAGKRVNALTLMLEKDRAYDEGKKILEKLKTLIPRQLFMVALQAAIGGRVIARENIAASSKNVTQHMYGGDRTRKMKLWKKQKEGKKRLRAEGEVEIPHSVYLQVFKK